MLSIWLLWQVEIANSARWILAVLILAVFIDQYQIRKESRV